MAVGEEEAGGWEVLAAPGDVVADEEDAGVVGGGEVEVEHFLYLGSGEDAEAETLVVDIVATTDVDADAIADVAVKAVDGGKDFWLGGKETEGIVAVDAAGVLEVVVEQDVGLWEVGWEAVAEVLSALHAVVGGYVGGFDVFEVAHDGWELVVGVVP